MEQLLNQIQNMIGELKTSSDHMLFQNHLYGCLYLCELIEKKEVANLEPFKNPYIFNDIGKNYGYEETTFVSDEIYTTLWNNVFDLLLKENIISVLQLEQEIVKILDRDEEHTYFLDNLSEEIEGEIEEEVIEGDNEETLNDIEIDTNINNDNEDEDDDGNEYDEGDNENEGETSEGETQSQHIVEIQKKSNEIQFLDDTKSTNKKRKTIHKGHRSITPIKHRKGVGKTRKNRKKNRT